MKNFRNFFHNYINIVFAVIILICTSMGMLFGYLYGASDSKVSQYSSIMSTDLRAKKEDLNFLHGYVDYTTNMKAIDKYKNNLSLQQKTIYKYRYFNSYLLSTKNKQVVDFHTNFVDNGNETTLENTHLAMVRNYWDASYMESIGIPLFYINEKNEKNNISSKNKDIDFGCYISSSHAYNIAARIGLLNDGETDESKIKTAFFKLINSPDSYYLRLNSVKGENTFTINNIYIDTPFFMKLLTKDQQYISDHNFGNYCYHFAKYNRNTIFTHAQDLFSDESFVYFDIIESTSNISLFLENVVGKDYLTNSMKIQLDTGFESVDSLSEVINKAYSKTSKGNLAYILLSFLFFELVIFVQSSYISLRNTKRYSWIFKLLLPSMPFICLWLFLSLMMLFTNNTASLFFIFNYMGNIVTILFLLVITIFSIVLKLLGDDDEKLFIR